MVVSIDRADRPSKVVQELEGALTKTLQTHDKTDFLKAIKQALASDGLLRAKETRFLTDWFEFLRNFSPVAGQRILDAQAEGLLRPFVAHFIFSLDVVENSEPATRVSPRVEVSKKNQVSEFLSAIETGRLESNISPFGIRSYELCNFGPHFIRNTNVHDKSVLLLWSRETYSWWASTEPWKYVLDFSSRSAYLPPGAEEPISYFCWAFEKIVKTTVIYAKDLEYTIAANLDKSWPRRSAFRFEGLWHIGHEIWNSLSAFYFFGAHRWRFDAVFVQKGVCLHGNPHDLFRSGCTNVVEYDTDDELIEIFARNPDYICFPVRHDYVSKAAARAIFEGLDVSANFREWFTQESKGRVALIIGVRCGSRECVNQSDVIVAAVKALRVLIPGSPLLVVLDGAQVRGPSGGTHQQILVEREREVLEAVKAELAPIGDINVVGTIDMTYPESCYCAARGAFFVSPWGAGLAKTCWVGRVSGIVYGNHYILGGAETNQGEYSLYHSPHWVEGPPDLLYPPSAIIHSEEVNGHGGKFNNFRIKVDALARYIDSHTEWITAKLRVANE